MKDEPEVTWTKGGFLDHLEFQSTYQPNPNAAPDTASIVVLRTIPSVTLYVGQGNWLRMNPQDMFTLGSALLEGAAAWGVGTHPNPIDELQSFESDGLIEPGQVPT